MADILTNEQIRSAATRAGVRANPIDYDAWLAEHDREVRVAERERIYREVRGIPAWGTLEEREDHGGFDVPGQNARALVLAAIRTDPDDGGDSRG